MTRAPIDPRAESGPSAVGARWRPAPPSATRAPPPRGSPLGVRANAVAFGMIDTRMTNSFADGNAVSVGGEAVPQGVPEHVAKMWHAPEFLQMAVPLARKGTADEAAAGMLFLASPLSSYVSGHTLEVTGGFGI